ncbi:aquaporin-4-like isoform X2 [Lethenteron reissneri]|nr:aquaporin-4-like isoform X2 [Lethenteron reissneri]
MTACRGVWTQRFWRSLLAELLGTALLVMLGAGSTLTWSEQHPASYVQVSLCFGLAVAALAQCLGGASGAHLNPAVTAALLVARRVPLSRGVAYVAAQSLGATLGAALLLLVTPGDVAGDLGATLVSSRLQLSHAVLVEAAITLQLVLTVCAAGDERRSDLAGGSGALHVGLSVALGHLFALPYTGSSMNPARSLGSAVVSGLWANHWVYWLGPLLGGCLGGPLYHCLLYPDRESKRRLKGGLEAASPFHPATSTITNCHDNDTNRHGNSTNHHGNDTNRHGNDTNRHGNNDTNRHGNNDTNRHGNNNTNRHGNDDANRPHLAANVDWPFAKRPRAAAEDSDCVVLVGGGGGGDYDNDGGLGPGEGLGSRAGLGPGAGLGPRGGLVSRGGLGPGAGLGPREGLGPKGELGPGGGLGPRESLSLGPGYDPENPPQHHQQHCQQLPTTTTTTTTEEAAKGEGGLLMSA